MKELKDLGIFDALLAVGIGVLIFGWCAFSFPTVKDTAPEQVTSSYETMVETDC